MSLEITCEIVQGLIKKRIFNMKIFIFKSGSGHWFFNVKGKNNKIVCQSEGYLRKSDAVKTVKRLQESLVVAEIKILT